jgi:hypothetical protein
MTGEKLGVCVGGEEASEGVVGAMFLDLLADSGAVPRS